MDSGRGDAADADGAAVEGMTGGQTVRQKDMHIYPHTIISTWTMDNIIYSIKKSSIFISASDLLPPPTAG